MVADPARRFDADNAEKPKITDPGASPATVDVPHSIEEVDSGRELQVVLHTVSAEKISLASPKLLEVKSATNCLSIPLPCEVLDCVSVTKVNSTTVVKLRKAFGGENGTHEPMDVSDEEEACDGSESVMLESATDEYTPPAKFRVVENVKTDFTEFGENDLTVHMYVKEIDEDSLKVDFKDKSFSVIFRTKNADFLSSQSLAENEGLPFLWDVDLKDQIKPKESGFKLSKTKLELKLKKAASKKWGAYLRHLRLPSGGFEHSKPPAVRWFSAACGGDADMAKPSPLAALNAARALGKDSNWNARISSSEDANNNDSDDEVNSDVENSDSDDDCTPIPLLSDVGPSRIPRIVSPGMTGLNNFGNTCFMNSIIQCLANTRNLRDYFLRRDYVKDLNRENPLGMQGKLANAFGALLHDMWSGENSSVTPVRIKSILAHKASQFLGYAQHDAHEFMAFLLDGLHEDLNRVKEKPYTKTVESGGRPEAEVAQEAWETYKSRNDSVIVDLFQGQYRSKLTCPLCGEVSITFDPFLYLSVPLPKEQVTFEGWVFRLNLSSEPSKFSVSVAADSTVENLAVSVGKMVNIESDRLRLAFISGRFFEDVPGRLASVSYLHSRYSNAIPCFYEVMFSEDWDDPVIEFRVTQRLASPPEVRACSSCRRSADSLKRSLMRCNGCFRVAYCGRECQADHWPEHKQRCRLFADLIGRPFIVSLKRSACTFSNLAHLLESCAMKSVDVFQPPVGGEVGELVPGGVVGAFDSNRRELRDLKTPPSDAEGPASLAYVAPVVAGESAVKSEGQLDGLSRLVSGDDDPEVTYQGLNTPSKSVLKHSRLLNVNQGEVVAAVLDCSLNPGATGEQEAPNCNENSSDITSSCAIDSDDDVDDSSPLIDDGNNNSLFGKNSDTNLSIKSDASLAELHVKRKFPQFDVFILPRHVDVNTHSRDLLRVTSGGLDRVLPLRSRCIDIVMDWRNNTKEKGYVVVADKPSIVPPAPRDQNVACGSRNDSKTVGVERATIYDCLKLFSEPEQLRKEEAWFCPGCRSHQEATKELSLWRLPKILVFQLKRFSFVPSYVRDKVDRMIWFPTRGLDVGPFCVAEDGRNAIYDLYGVVNHFGCMIGGHYTSYVRLCDSLDSRKTEIGWRNCDDSRVTEVNEGVVVSRAAYVLFYKLREVPDPVDGTLLSNGLTRVGEGLLDQENLLSVEDEDGAAPSVYTAALNGLVLDGGREVVDEPPTVTDL